MINWLLIIVVVLAIVLFFKFLHFKNRVFLVILAVILLFLFFSFSLVTKDKGLNMSTFSGLSEAGKVYFAWMGQAFSNLKTITGDVIGMDWVPENQTVSDLNPKNYMRG